MQLFAAFSTCISFGCAPTLTGHPTQPLECAVGQTCELFGTLNIFRGVPASGANIERDGYCLPVALPPSVVRAWKDWNGKKVLVSAHGLQRSHEGPEIAFVDYQGRNLASGMCPAGEVVAYASRVRKAK